ncbi:hypothetical protein PAPYR_4051 [Paratrimastix pyriformis]|uniref:Uncharacterized protein n=1 Tax=Paratrimastix pyriformis TaxID=342808 RepID=A0ABQ8ULA0_9EUKA|nr:hypothetical protein PAPYR_4051 [Paratrimastix pyriformis]
MLSGLPVELLWDVVAKSSFSLGQYCILIATCHEIRSRMLGTATVLDFQLPCSFSDEQPALAPIVPSAQAVSALVGPCRNLKELKFSPDYGLTGCGKDTEIWSKWVTPAFSGHDCLRVLHMPPFFRGWSDSALVGILSLIGSSLEELYLGDASHPSDHVSDPQHLMVAIGVRCPKLRVLEMHSADSPTEIAVLAPLCPRLERLVIKTGSCAFLEAFPGLCSFSDLNGLSMTRLDTATDSLHAMLLDAPAALSEFHCSRLPGDLDHLPALLSATPTVSIPMALLAEEADPVSALLDMPQIKHLRLQRPFQDPDELEELEEDCCQLAKGQLTALVGRLESFSIEHYQITPILSTLQLHGPTLRTLDLGVLFVEGECALDCPCLTTLIWGARHPKPLHLHCPALRTLRLANLDTICLPQPSDALPALERLVVTYERMTRHSPYLLRLAQCFPALRSLAVTTMDAGALEMCLANPPPSLVKLDWNVKVTSDFEQTIRLPPQLVSLDLRVDGFVKDDVARLDLNAPGVSHLVVSSSHPLPISLDCPRLTRCTIRGDCTGLTIAPGAPLRELSLTCDRLPTDGLEGSLRRFASTLRAVNLEVNASKYRLINPEIFGAMPHLASLSLKQVLPTGPLRCPHLVKLCLTDRSGHAQEISLKCPVLEELHLLPSLSWKRITVGPMPYLLRWDMPFRFFSIVRKTS